ncbi:hypothetical protein [Mucilaginibacter ginkgonis]|uniref:Uncharacterized protein n=1 Tax=Mucilaginibacter ginkgonis TaxID=2682091 RepID=A0A6I4IMK6_9SPHI|nr:hypothetical protein [Mucilaginibacter ginkgonis]QQL50145.1 hypothetical protein GO620_001455 [Mucilaginibacter ginkgonis]
MKKLITIIALVLFSFSTFAQQHMTKSGKPDKRYNENKHLKKDGTPDMRYSTSKKAMTKKKP